MIGDIDFALDQSAADAVVSDLAEKVLASLWLAVEHSNSVAVQPVQIQGGDEEVLCVEGAVDEALHSPVYSDTFIDRHIDQEARLCVLDALALHQYHPAGRR